MMKSKTSKKKAARRIIHEDFGNELRDYLDKWSARQHGGDNEGWKFNKVVQTWALDHCFDKKKIDSKLFKSLLPYVLTVKGAALNRLSERAQEIVNGLDKQKAPSSKQATDDGEDDGENVGSSEGTQTSIPRSMHRRAQKILAEIDSISSLSDG